MFDVNDFDETLPGPWEWDVKRLAASLEVAARDNGFAAKKRRDIVAAAVASYRQAMRGFADMTNLDVWYAHADVDQLRAGLGAQLTRAPAQAAGPGHGQGADQGQHAGSGQAHPASSTGEPRIIVRPAAARPGRRADSRRRRPERLRWADRRASSRSTGARWRPTAGTCSSSIEFCDMARKVVGVGSVGTRCWIVLMLGRDAGDPLFLQVKEAEESVLSRFVGAEQVHQPGPAGGRGPAADAGGQRHLPRLAADPGRARRQGPATSTCASSGTGSSPSTSRP